MKKASIYLEVFFEFTIFLIQNPFSSLEVRRIGGKLQFYCYKN